MHDGNDGNDEPGLSTALRSLTEAGPPLGFTAADLAATGRRSRRLRRGAGAAVFTVAAMTATFLASGHLPGSGGGTVTAAGRTGETKAQIAYDLDRAFRSHLPRGPQMTLLHDVSTTSISGVYYELDYAYGSTGSRYPGAYVSVVSRQSSTAIIPGCGSGEPGCVNYVRKVVDGSTVETNDRLGDLPGQLDRRIAFAWRPDGTKVIAMVRVEHGRPFPVTQAQLLSVVTDPKIRYRDSSD